MMAWYSRDKSSLRSSARRSREISSGAADCDSGRGLMACRGRNARSRRLGAWPRGVSWNVFSSRVRLVAQQLRNRRRRAYSEPEPHAGGAVPRHAADDQVLPRWLRREAHVVCCFRRKPLRKLEGERTWDRRIAGQSRRRRLRGDHLRAVRQHPVMVTEVDLRLPTDGYDERELPVAEPVEVQGAVKPGESSDQLEADGLGGRVEAQPGRIYVLLLGRRGRGGRRRTSIRHGQRVHRGPKRRQGIIGELNPITEEDRVELELP